MKIFKLCNFVLQTNMTGWLLNSVFKNILHKKSHRNLEYVHIQEWKGIMWVFWLLKKLFTKLLIRLCLLYIWNLYSIEYFKSLLKIYIFLNIDRNIILLINQHFPFKHIMFLIINIKWWADTWFKKYWRCVLYLGWLNKIDVYWV